MAVEIELKMSLAEFAPVRDALRHLGAKGGKLTRETNVFFDTADRALLAAGAGLRVRVNQDATSGQETCVITHKGPLRPGAAKSREETELVVADANAAADLFGQLGYRKTLSFQKRRESWELAGCKVELDELPRLGRFVEIEGPDEATILRVREQLGLGDRPLIKTGYVSLLADNLKSRGDSSTEINFDSPGA